MNKKIISAGIALLLLSFSFAVSAQEKGKEDAKREKEELIREREEERSEERARSRYRVAGVAIPEFEVPEAPPVKAYSYGDNFFMVSSGGSSSSQLSLSKKFDGNSNENEGSFDVDDAVRHISLSFSGSVEEGEIEIVITLPDGDELKDITIDSSADITFTQTIKIAEDEDKYFGTWNYSVEAEKAVGYYRLSINTR